MRARKEFLCGLASPCSSNTFGQIESGHLGISVPAFLLLPEAWVSWCNSLELTVVPVSRAQVGRG